MNCPLPADLTLPELADEFDSLARRMSGVERAFERTRMDAVVGLLTLGALVWLLSRRIAELEANVQSGWGNGERTLSDHWRRIDALEQSHKRQVEAFDAAHNRSRSIEERANQLESRVDDLRVELDARLELRTAVQRPRGFLNRLVS